MTLEVNITSPVRASVTSNDFHETRYRLHKTFRASTSFEKICSVTHILLKGVHEFAVQFPYFVAVVNLVTGVHDGIRQVCVA